MRSFAQFIPVVMLIAVATHFFGCSPKSTGGPAATTGEPATPVKPVESNDPCEKFQDSRAGQASLDAHVIYRDYIRIEEFEQAMPFWRQAYTFAPAADGERQTHFEDGIDIYDYLLNKTDDKDKKLLYLDTIYQIYNHLGQCYYPDEPGYVAARKAFDEYYKYKSLVSDEQIYGHFTEALDAYGMNTPAFVVNPFTALLVDMFNAGKIDKEEALNRARMIYSLTDAHSEDNEEGWPIVNSYAPLRLEDFETVRGFYDCDYYLDKYYADIRMDSVECEEFVVIISRLLWGGCQKESEEVQNLYMYYSANCAPPTSPNKFLADARLALEEGRYQDAIDNYLGYIAEKDDPDVLARFNLRVANIYYAHLKQFGKARQYAYEALKHRPNWGEPYMVIGKLYASSGPLCGPGRGWDSQIVTWPAIDKFIKAKSVDPPVAADANK